MSSMSIVSKMHNKKSSSRGTRGNVAVKNPKEQEKALAASREGLLDVEKRKKTWLSKPASNHQIQSPDQDSYAPRNNSLSSSSARSSVKPRKTTTATTTPVTSSSKSHQNSMAGVQDYIREEIQRELSKYHGSHAPASTSASGTGKEQELREDLLEKLNSTLHGELHGHLCPSCRELMESPHHTPLLLIPCGHTFCKACWQQQHNEGRLSCSYCREHVRDTVVNQNLQTLIDHFLSQRNQIQNAPLHDLFHMGSALHQRHDPSGQYGYSRSQYRGQVQSCQIRMNILQNQEDEEQQHLQSLNKKLTSSQKALTLLHQEKQKVQEKISSLQEELQLIEEHIATQEEKTEEIQQESYKVDEDLQRIHASRCQVEQEMEKYRLLAEG